MDSYYPIGNIAAGPAANNNYSFEDQQASGTAYYRLRMEDIDGRFTYSNILRLTRTDNKEISSVFPNPVSSGFSVTYIRPVA
ncbi:MAG: hypothetical protein WDO19_24770 [Bacteroidota bacterium]